MTSHTYQQLLHSRCTGGFFCPQIIGETSTGDMLNVNPTKTKELTNFRNKGKEDHIVLQVCPRPLLPSLVPVSTDGGCVLSWA